MSLQQVCADAVEAVFRNTDVTLAATYNGTALRVVRRVVDEAQRFFQGSVRLAAAKFDVREADVTQPVAGDLLVTGGITYVVRSYVRGAKRLVWSLDVDAV